MTLQFTVDGTTPIEVQMKNVTAQKAAPIVKAATNWLRNSSGVSFAFGWM